MYSYKLNYSVPMLEQKVIPVPDVAIYHRKLNTNDDLLILACDGIFEEMKNNQVLSTIRTTIKLFENLEESNEEEILVNYSDISRILISKSLKLGSMDNMSAIIAPLINCN